MFNLNNDDDDDLVDDSDDEEEEEKSNNSIWLSPEIQIFYQHLPKYISWTKSCQELSH